MISDSVFDSGYKLFLLLQRYSVLDVLTVNQGWRLSNRERRMHPGMKDERQEMKIFYMVRINLVVVA